ncbi:MAG: tRNA modification GTPase [Myxococcota bacterium]
MAGDAIVAAATPHGHSALALVRLTGPGLEAILDAVARPHRPGPWFSGRPRRIDVLHEGDVFDDGVLVARRGPGTATGEDLVEITVHGNPLIVTHLVEACVDAGGRVAQPGEFTRRAVLAGRLDLVKAEAINQAIRATSPGGLRLGRAGMDGRLGARLEAFRTVLIDVTAELEARLDYPADELAYETDEALVQRLAEVTRGCRALAATHQQGRMLVDGARVAFVGPVNAGKSSLFNALLGEARALVHEGAGTTRDVVEAKTQLGPLSVTLIDTAGERPTQDPVEAAGLQLAQRFVEAADLLVVVIRGKPSAPDEIESALLQRTADRARVVCVNGIDREGVVPVDGAVVTSARTGEGVAELSSAIVKALGMADLADLAVASARQRDLLGAVARAADDAIEALPLAGVAVAADLLTEGLERLDELTGADTREDVLDRVFERFCIGK